MNVIPTGETLGATVEGIDLNRELDRAAFAQVDERSRPIGARDAGQDWHTDMSYSETIAFANVLYALKVPTATGSRSAAPNSPTCTPPMTGCRRS